MDAYKHNYYPEKGTPHAQIDQPLQSQIANKNCRKDVQQRPAQGMFLSPFDAQVFDYQMFYVIYHIPVFERAKLIILMLWCDAPYFINNIN